MLPVPEALTRLVHDGDVLVLSGAGLSTESGIPDYRGETGRARPATPMTYQDFTGSAQNRQRYWARSHAGWRRIARALPNDGHRAVAALQRQGLLSGVVTQNVDGLHTAAGATDVIELHGALDRVVCLSCGEVTPRDRLEERLTEANPAALTTSDEVKPDGDADLGDTSGFVVVDCERCGGLLKPDVVFFGEPVPRPRAARVFELLDASAALLVLGSSLTVMSGYRFVLHAAKHHIPVAIVNQGATRGDAQATLKVEAPLGEVLSALAAAERLPG